MVKLEGGKSSVSIVKNILNIRERSPGIFLLALLDPEGSGDRGQISPSISCYGGPGGGMEMAEAIRCPLNHAIPAAHSDSINLTTEDPTISIIRHLILSIRAALRRRFSGGWLIASHNFARLPSGLVPKSSPAWLTRRIYAWALCFISSSVLKTDEEVYLLAIWYKNETPPYP